MALFSISDFASSFLSLNRFFNLLVGYLEILWKYTSDFRQSCGTYLLLDQSLSLRFNSKRQLKKSFSKKENLLKVL